MKKKWAFKNDNQWGLPNWLVLSALLLGLFSGCGALYMVAKTAGEILHTISTNP